MNIEITRKEFIRLIAQASILISLSGSLPIVLRDRRLVRPPGAVTEERFTSICVRCGKCVEVCPTHAIALAGLEDGVKQAGTPKMDALRGPCEAIGGRCEEGLRCALSCPTEALRQIKTEDIKLGSVILDRRKCISWAGESCLVCYEVCPLIDMHKHAITVTKENAPVFHPDICAGCGKCVYACPAIPKALELTPKLEKRTGWLR